MHRRVFLSSLAVGAVGVSGCITGGRVVLERNKSITVRPERGWWVSLPDIGGNGAISCTVRAGQPFDVYYFTSADSFGTYKTYVQGGDPQEMPGGDRDLGQAAVRRDGKYGVKIPENGGRKHLDTEGDHYFVVDHSNYGSGVPVEEYGDPLDAFVDLQIIDRQSPI